MKLEIGAKLGDGWSVDAICPKCGENESECRCTQNQKVLPKNEHRLVFRREKRRGKPVICAGEFFLEDSEMKGVLKSLKKKLAVGGTVKNGWVEMQGEIQEKMKNELVAMGFRCQQK